jgi:N-acylneuraminate cytidylyltransferase
MKVKGLEGKRVAFVPARSGSVRVIDKNIRDFFGHPLMAYTIRCAIEAEMFDEVVCVTDSPDYAKIAVEYGATVPDLRPAGTASSTSPDISWVSWALDLLESSGQSFEVFSILRPTSPFRRIETISRAWSLFEAKQPADSLRAIRACKEHPGKMWVVDEDCMKPLLSNHIDGVPWHSNQTALLPDIYIQDASLEIALTNNIKLGKGISGDHVVPFISEGFEGFDINTIDDWIRAEELVRNGEVDLLAI